MLIEIKVDGNVEELEVGSYEEAVEAFEEALWEAGILSDDERLNAADLGIAGCSDLALILERQGFLNYGKGSDLPYVAVIERDEDLE